MNVVSPLASTYGIYPWYRLCVIDYVFLTLCYLILLSAFCYLLIVIYSQKGF